MDRRAQDELLEVLEALRQKVGPNGQVIPVGSLRYYPSAVVVPGFVYPLQLVARAFADPEKGHADLSSPLLLVYEGTLMGSQQLHKGLVPVLEHLRGHKPGAALAVLAYDVDGVVLDALINAHQRKVCSVAAVCCAELEQSTATHYLRTIAHMCGATLLGAAAALDWPAALGKAGQILSDRRRIVILDPARPGQAPMPAQTLGLLSVGGNDARDVFERIEWVEGLLGH